MKEPSSINLSLSLALTILCVAESAWQNDTLARTQFLLQTDRHDNLLFNWTGSDTCSAAWLGVECSTNGIMVCLSLPSFVYLRFVDHHENRLNGTFSPLLSFTALEHLYLSHNDFSGDILPQISSLSAFTSLRTKPAVQYPFKKPN
ncbi:hypothetical protein DEO72_LG9g3101 [Vigna unguiculata]|uniref:Leucine-rich repeat-containing N-terminal plant-type domain-containing protein n=1 Tax=Vigna unguiculata TaxID=3917 RepID=A0A4D6N801_VIGUN|nr:hypothetical protein DEO72_LG9g3101 [Vigna unguiculata]